MNKKQISILALVCIIFWPVLIGTARAVEEPYTVISKKNLFHPERKEWIMDEAAKPAETAVSQPKIDPKQIQLMGTVLVGDIKKAVITTQATKGPQKESEIYMSGDYIEGFLLKEIQEKQVVISNPATNEEITLFLHEGKSNRSPVQKTDAGPPPAAIAPPTPGKRTIPRQRSETAQQLFSKVERTLNVLKRTDNEMVKRQARRDLDKIKKLIPYMSEQERRRAVELDQALEETVQKK